MRKFAILLVLVCSAALKAEDTVSLAYLKNPVGARPVGMGETFTGLSNDINCVFYNPAALSSMSKYSFSFSHIEFLQGIRYELLSGLIPVGAGSSGAISVIYINNGLQEKRDAYGVVEGDFTPYQVVPIFSFAGNIAGGLSLGGNVKLPYESIDTYNSIKVVFDFAGFYRADKNYSFGVNLQNIGAYNDLPVNLKLGAAYQDNFLQAGLDVNIPYRSNISLSSGAEIMVVNNCFIRGGLRHKMGEKFDLVSNITLGFGFIYDIFSLDYGFKMYDELGNTHFISLIVKLK